MSCFSGNSTVYRLFKRNALSQKSQLRIGYIEEIRWPNQSSTCIRRANCANSVRPFSQPQLKDVFTPSLPYQKRDQYDPHPHIHTTTYSRFRTCSATAIGSTLWPPEMRISVEKYLGISTQANAFSQRAFVTALFTDKKFRNLADIPLLQPPPTMPFLHFN